MSEGINRVILLGNIGAAPEVRVVSGGKAMMQLRVATNLSYLDGDNKRVTKTEWHRVTVWGRRAEGLARVLAKGDVVYIEGRLQTRTFEKNGEKRYSTDIEATNVIVPSGGSKPRKPREDGPQRAPITPGGGGGSAPSDLDDYGELPPAQTSAPSDTRPSSALTDDDIPF